jgi:hypothetical protein
MKCSVVVFVASQPLQAVGNMAIPAAAMALILLTLD